MTARFASVSSRLSSMRGTVPQFHSVEQGGTTQILDAFWIDQPGTTAGHEVQDAEGESSSRRAVLRFCSRRVSGSLESTLEGSASGPLALEPYPGLAVAEDTTMLRDALGNETWRTERWTLAWVDPALPPGMDNAGQILVAHFVGDPAAAEVATFQVAAATGTWTGATNLLVMADPEIEGTRRVFVVRTLHRQGGSVLDGAGPAAALGGL